MVGQTPQAIQRALDCLTRDEQLRTASGRWVPGHPDPDQFVPGDVAAVRVGAGKPILLSGWRADPHGNRLRVFFQFSDLLQHQLKALDLLDLTAAVPNFLPTAAALGVLASRPPDPQLLQELRLPFERIFVLFGVDPQLADPASPPWPLPQGPGRPRNDWHHQIRWDRPDPGPRRPARHPAAGGPPPTTTATWTQGPSQPEDAMLTRQDLPRTNPARARGRVLDADLAGDHVDRQLPQGPDDPHPLSIP